MDTYTYIIHVPLFSLNIFYAQSDIHYNMTIIKHYINNRWNWDFDGSHTAYDVVSQITDQYKYDDICKIYTDLSS